MARIERQLAEGDSRLEIIMDGLEEAIGRLGPSARNSRRQVRDIISVHQDLLEEMRRLVIQDLPYLRSQREEAREQLR